MGKALYRKYRSTSLDEIIGQEHITETLKNALKKGAISHAYLFTGPRGTGKTSIARILAHEINKIPYSDESTHLDIIEIDAASNRRIDEIRELRDKVHIAPTSVPYKVYIIDEVHMLTREAFNALLKTLEEPPEHAVFMLATTEAHKIPDTIMSRTQRYTLKPIPLDKAELHLAAIAEKENIPITKEAITLLANHGMGSFRDSISMLDQLSGRLKEEFTVEDVQFLLGIPAKDNIDSLIEAVANNDTQKIFSSVRELKEHGVESSKAAQAVSATLRESLINETRKLDRKQTIELLKNLIPLTGNSKDYIGLELAFLSVVESNQDSKNKQTHHTKRINKSFASDVHEPSAVLTVEDLTTSKVVEVESESATLQPHITKTEESVNKSIDLKNWKDLLDAVKLKHNTLYGVLRMATPQDKDGAIELQFNFDFHKKQLETTKNRPIVDEYFKKYLGTSNLSAVVKKAANKPEEKPAEKHVEKNDLNAVETVSNIFGSAELLES
jgi:DNA polymerase-3 subunit gamma/tau